jgi:FixJ family two-component response regulator
MPQYSKSVLLVDDDPADRKLFTRALQRQGFDVISTGSAEEAMTAIMAGGIGCLVTDQIMAVTGHELASIAAGIRSDLGIVFISGAFEPRGDLPSGAIFVSKDNRPQILRTVADCMEQWKLIGSE